MNPILGVSLVFSFSVFYSFSSKSTSSFSAFVKIPFTVLFFNPSSYGTAPLTYWRVCPIMYLVPSISIGSSRRISSSVPRKRPRYSKDCCFSSSSLCLANYVFIFHYTGYCKGLDGCCLFKSHINYCLHKWF